MARTHCAFLEKGETRCCAPVVAKTSCWPLLFQGHCPQLQLHVVGAAYQDRCIFADWRGLKHGRVPQQDQIGVPGHLGPGTRQVHIWEELRVILLLKRYKREEADREGANVTNEGVGMPILQARVSEPPMSMKG